MSYSHTKKRKLIAKLKKVHGKNWYDFYEDAVKLIKIKE